MAFHDVRLPEDVERGALGGPRFKTTVMELSSGEEKRNIEWSKTRGAWQIGYGIESKEDFDDVKAFFYARQGRAHSFRFKDWSDYEIGEEGSPQQIGTGNGVALTFQIEKRYTSGGYTFHREIKKPVDGTLRVFKNGVEQLAGWSCNYATGVITFSVAPGNLVAVQVICEFDVAARFETDALDINMAIFDAGSIPNIDIVEVRTE